MTVNIRGKEYVTVAERVALFREKRAELGTIETELLQDDGDSCTFKASVYVQGELIATGYAKEVRTASAINKTSYIENCETSAVGRALAFCGYGMVDGIASADEVAGAIEAQEPPRAKLDYSALTEALEEYAAQHGKPLQAIKREANAKLGRGATQEDVDRMAASYREETLAAHDIEF